MGGLILGQSDQKMLMTTISHTQMSSKIGLEMIGIEGFYTSLAIPTLKTYKPEQMRL